jgi:DNA-nicking Smr family endonuclease
MEKMLASSKLDMEETANKIKDRRYTFEDQIRLSGMTLENAKRVMMAYNRSLAMAAERLAGMSIDEVLQFEASDSV